MAALEARLGAELFVEAPSGQVLSETGRLMLMLPANSVVATPSLLIPIFCKVFSSVGNAPKTPIEPVMVLGCAKMLSALQAR